VLTDGGASRNTCQYLAIRGNSGGKEPNRAMIEPAIDQH